MKVSTKGRYGLRALVDLTVSTIDAPVPLADIAGRQNISLNYLEQVFGQLRRAGIVRSIKGSGGGYRLERCPTNYSKRSFGSFGRPFFYCGRFRESGRPSAKSDTASCLGWDRPAGQQFSGRKNAGWSGKRIWEVPAGRNDVLYLKFLFTHKSY